MNYWYLTDSAFCSCSDKNYTFDQRMIQVNYNSNNVLIHILNDYLVKARMQIFSIILHCHRTGGMLPIGTTLSKRKSNQRGTTGLHARNGIENRHSSFSISVKNENHEKTTMSAAQNVSCICNINKTGMCGNNMKYHMSQPFSALQ